jgi:hypothetical protein
LDEANGNRLISKLLVCGANGGGWSVTSSYSLEMQNLMSKCLIDDG